MHVALLAQGAPSLCSTCTMCTTCTCRWCHISYIIYIRNGDGGEPLISACPNLLYTKCAVYLWQAVLLDSRATVFTSAGCLPKTCTCNKVGRRERMCEVAISLWMLRRGVRWPEAQTNEQFYCITLFWSSIHDHHMYIYCTRLATATKLLSSPLGMYFVKISILVAGNAFLLQLATCVHGLDTYCGHNCV